MIIRNKFFCLICLIVLCAGVMPAHAKDDAKKKAVASANEWLGLIDKNQYFESWQTAAAFFKNALTAEQWRQSLEGVRRPLGKVMQRTVKSAQSVNSLPGAPDGSYVVIQYETSFEDKRSAVETVTPMLDKDGRWRVSGYYIR